MGLRSEVVGAICQCVLRCREELLQVGLHRFAPGTLHQVLVRGLEAAHDHPQLLRRMLAKVLQHGSGRGGAHPARIQPLAAGAQRRQSQGPKPRHPHRAQQVAVELRQESVSDLAALVRAGGHLSDGHRHVRREFPPGHDPDRGLRLEPLPALYVIDGPFQLLAGGVADGGLRAYAQVQQVAAAWARHRLDKAGHRRPRAIDVGDAPRHNFNAPAQPRGPQAGPHERRAVRRWATRGARACK
mmetsp:Transcript_43914/g.122134  ORF Transcript_43914/g.122134 Transcript_43914/m.122134 type:complete len:242 (+) Transcript_43914:123-848(+)